MCCAMDSTLCSNGEIWNPKMTHRKGVHMALKMRNIIALLLIFAGGAQAALTNDFVGYYEFDENGNDTSGSSSANLGTLHGSSANFSGSALFGSGSLHVQSGAYCSLGNPTDYQFGTGSFTITYWLNTPANVSSDPTLVGIKIGQAVVL